MMLNNNEINFTNYKFMQLFGNCACISYLGDARVHGPIDNVIATDIKLLDLLLSNSYLQALKEAPFEKLPRSLRNIEADFPYTYNFPFAQIKHNDPTTAKYYTELEKRIAVFNQFYAEVLSNKNYFFVISLNDFLVNRELQLVNSENLQQLIDRLIEKNILDKCIFVGTKLKNRHNSWHYYATDFKQWIQRYNLKYIEIIDLSTFYRTNAPEQFKKQFIRLMTKER